MSDQNQSPRNIEDAERMAQKYGITLTPDDYADMQNVMQERQRQLETQLSATDTHRGRMGTFVDQFNRFYPKFLKTLIGIGDVLITGTQTVLIAFGVPALLIMLMIVEQQRVYHGMALFEIVESLAAFSAWVLVLANLVFELLIGWKENQVGYTEPPKTDFSFRTLAKRIRYILGRDTDWQPRQKSPAIRYKAVLRIVTFTILVLALAGSMRSIIQTTNGNWVGAIWQVFTQSTLLQMVTWIGGLLFAVAAVLSAQALSQYVALKVIEVIAIMKSSTEDKPNAMLDAVGMTGAAFMMARIKERQRERRIAATAAANVPAVSGVYQVVSGTLGTGNSTAKTPDASQVGSETPKQLSPKIQEAVSWLERNSETIEGLSVRKLAEQAGVSVATMQRAIEYRRNVNGA
jgi:hypothetical protein